MRLRHAVITRFCYRIPQLQSGGVDRRSYDPLEPANLEHRLTLLEIAPLPSLLSQTEQDFEWVIAIDRDLDPLFRGRLKRLVDVRPRTHLHEFDRTTGLGTSGWLVPYVGGFEDGDYLVTTNLDDDDALPRNYVAELQAAIRRQAESGAPLLLLGAGETAEWDLTLSNTAPRGWTAPWHRHDPLGTHVASCGFTLASRQPQYPFTVISQIHLMARQYLDFAVAPTHPNVQEARDRFRRAALAAGDNLEAYRPEDTFVDLSPLVGPALMTNHQLNLQATRVLETKPGIRRVEGPQTFPAFTLGWGALDREAAHFQVTRRFTVQRRLLQARRFAERAARWLNRRVRRLTALRR